MKIESIGASNIQNGINAKQVSEEKAFEEVLKKAYNDGDKERLMEACRDFEGILLGIMFKQMKKTIPESKFMPKSYAREIFEDMLDEELVNKSKGTGIGIAEILYRQLSTNLDNIYKISENDPE
ncbi:MAG: flagellar biosynthesis protein FlgJ [Clostridiaceae bacterium]|jgi:flagellar protein FlgJ|nr:flagellar biosynthesis protein FlgJ [Clostridiaceae bacterium]